MKTRLFAAIVALVMLLSSCPFSVTAFAWDDPADQDTEIAMTKVTDPAELEMLAKTLGNEQTNSENERLSKAEIVEQATEMARLEILEESREKSRIHGPSHHDFRILDNIQNLKSSKEVLVTLDAQCEAESIIGIKNSKTEIHSIKTGESISLKKDQEYYFNTIYNLDDRQLMYYGTISIVEDGNGDVIVNSQVEFIHESSLTYEREIHELFERGLSENKIIPDAEELLKLVPIKSRAGGVISETNGNNNTRPNAQVIYDDYDVYGTIAPNANDIDYYYIDFPRAGLVNIWLGVNYMGLTGVDYDLEIYLGLNSQNVAAGSYNGGSSDELISDFEIWEDTRIYICVSSYNGWDGVRQYKLRAKQTVYDDHAGSEEGATSVSVGSTTNGNLETSFDNDVFKFTTTQQMEVVCESLPYLDGNIYVDGRFWSGGYMVIDTNHSGGNGQFKITRSLPPGTHYVGISPSYGDTGTYKLKVSTASQTDDHGNTYSTATSISTSTSPKSGIINYGGDIDYFKFSVSNSSIGSYKMYTSGITDTKGYLYNQGQVELAYNDDGPSMGLNFCIQYNITTAGDYYIKVTGYNGTTIGNYSLYLQKVSIVDDHGNTKATATTLTMGTWKSGAIEVAGDVDYFKFNVTNATRGVYEFSSDPTYSTFNVVGTLYDNAAGDTAGYLVSDDNSNGNNQFKLDYPLDAGTYYLRVQHVNNNSTGNYRVRVRKLNVGIILIPGFGGSNFKNSSALYVWDPVKALLSTARLQSVYSDENGVPINALTVVNNETAFSDSFASLKSTLVNRFSDKYTVDLYTYDWRLSNVTTASNLQNYITTKGYDYVYLVAHSMGGLVSSQYMKSSTNLAKVKKLITIGTPYSGSASTLYAMEKGKQNSFINDLTLDNSVMKGLYINTSSMYQLFPTTGHANYIVNGNSTVTLANSTAFIGGRAFAKKNNGTGATKPMLNLAVSFHQGLMGSAISSHIARTSGKTYFIIGKKSTEDTINKVYYAGGQCDELGFGAGDGTVLISSASCGITSTGNGPLDSNVYAFNAGHTALLSEPTIRLLVGNVIDATAKGNATYNAPAPAGAPGVIESLELTTRGFVVGDDGLQTMFITDGVDRVVFTNTNGEVLQKKGSSLIIVNNGIEKEVGTIFPLDMEEKRVQYVLRRDVCTAELSGINPSAEVKVMYTDMGYYDTSDTYTGFEGYNALTVQLDGKKQTSFFAGTEKIDPERKANDLETRNTDSLTDILPEELYKQIVDSEELFTCVTVNNLEEIRFVRDQKVLPITKVGEAVLTELPDVLVIQTRSNGYLYLIKNVDALEFQATAESEVAVAEIARGELLLSKIMDVNQRAMVEFER